MSSRLLDRAAVYLGLVESAASRGKLQRVCQPSGDSSRREATAGLLLGLLLVAIFSYGTATSSVMWAVLEALVGLAVAVPLVIRAGRRMLVRSRG